jgi:UDP-glucose 4-epimerase
MKVFVTGGAGYIGSVTVEFLLNKGCEVVVFDNLERGHKVAIDERAQFIKGDLRNYEDIFSAISQTAPDAVMHFAAYALVGESMVSPEAYFRNNVAGGINLAEAMLHNNIKKIVFSSTCATYGQPEEVPIKEETPQKPENPYGESKLMFEKILLWYQQVHSFSPVFLRYFNACGATEKYGEDHTPETHLIPNIIRMALGKTKSLSIFGNDYSTKDGTCIRDYIHIVDLANAHWLALVKDVSGAFNLGTGTGCSVMEVVKAVESATGKKINVVIAPRRPGDPPLLVADYAKAARLLGWQPAMSSIENIVKSAWLWHKTHTEGYSKK